MTPDKCTPQAPSYQGTGPGLHQLRYEGLIRPLRPNLVEEVLVFGQQPALGDLTVPEAVEAVSPPRPLTALARLASRSAPWRPRGNHDIS